MSIFDKIFTAEGRLNRLRYLKYMLLLALVAGISTFVLSSMATFFTGDPESVAVKMITLAWVLIAGAGNVMLAIRRIHDLGKSGYFALILFVPFIGIIFSIALFCLPGQVGWNQYGEDPLTE